MSLCHDFLSHLNTVGDYSLETSKEVVSACIEADAALRASKRQAMATFYGDLATLFAAFVAYMVATANMRADSHKRKGINNIYPFML